MVDREAREPFTASELETLRAAARFVQRAIDNERVFVQLDRAKVEQGKLYRAARALACSESGERSTTTRKLWKGPPAAATCAAASSTSAAAPGRNP